MCGFCWDGKKGFYEIQWRGREIQGLKDRPAWTGTVEMDVPVRVDLLEREAWKGAGRLTVAKGGTRLSHQVPSCQIQVAVEAEGELFEVPRMTSWKWSSGKITQP